MATTSSSTLALEPGAIAGNPPPNGLPAQIVSGAAPWGDLAATVAPNFVSVQPVVLAAGTVLRRVFGYPDAADPWPSWETGSWWTRQPLPATEADWRGQYSVEAQWNGGQCVVAWTIPADIHGWAGPATLQAGEYADGSPAPDYYLPGGDEQIYIAPAQLPIGAWVPGATPWTPPPAPTAAAVTLRPAPSAPPAQPTLVTLCEALTYLMDALGQMATEAKAKGLDGGPLHFQARQLVKMQLRLKKYQTGKTAHLRAVLGSLTGLARHIHTSYPWSTHAAAAGAALHAVVTQADALLRAKAPAAGIPSA